MKKRIYILLVFLSITFLLGGCAYIDKANVWLKLKNQDFEYIKEGKVEKIIIQSTRNAGFRFVVTDKSTIKDLYSLLSSGKAVEKTSELEPDYIFEIHESSDKIHTFNYVAGLSGNDIGNFYSDNKVYRVNQRLDNDIISNMSYLRKPRDFQEIYYGSILKVLSQYGETINPGGSKSLGVYLDEDVESSKYIISVQLEDFKYDLSNVMKNAQLVKNNKENFDLLLKVKTQGYKTNVYKSILTLSGIEGVTDVKYYVRGNHVSGSWSIEVFDQKPQDW